MYITRITRICCAGRDTWKTGCSIIKHQSQCESISIYTDYKSNILLSELPYQTEHGYHCMLRMPALITQPQRAQALHLKKKFPIFLAVT